MGKFPKAAKLLIIPVIALSLAACSSKAQDSSTALSNPLEKDAGVYLGMYGKNSVDIETKESKKMFSLSKNAKDEVESLDKNDVVSFKYEQTESGDLVIHSIEKVNGTNSATEKPATKKEEVTKGTKQVNKPKETKEEEKKDGEREFNGYTMDIPSDINVTSDATGSYFSLAENDDYSVAIEKIDASDEIVKERWRAAGILKELGNLREITGPQIPYSFLSDSEFVFTGNNDTVTRFIAVKTINGQRFRFTFNHPTDKTSFELEGKLWNTISTMDVQ